MTTPNYDIDPNDSRLTGVKAEESAALTDNEKLYSGMASQSDQYYNKQIQAAQNYANTQKKNQQAQTDFAIEQINQQKAQAKQDYTKEQSGAYVDWQKQSNQYGANAEAMAAQGMQNTGFSESSQVSMYNTYQNRVSTARESYNRAVLNYDNAIKDARLQNNALLAEIAYNALQKQLELSLAGFQYKNTLLIEQANKEMEIKNIYHNQYQDVLDQINKENTLKENVRQYEQSYAEDVRQFNEKMAEEKRQYNESLAEQKRQFNATQAAKSSSGGSGTIKKSSGSGSSSSGKSGGGSGKSGITAVNKGSGEHSGSVGSTNNKKATEVSNRHADSWVEIPGHGRFSWAEVYAHVKDGTIKETTVNGKLKYTWVGKTTASVNVTPDAKGYEAKQRNLFSYRY